MIRWLFLFLGDFENGLEGWFIFSSVLLFVLLHLLFCAEDAVYIGTHGLEFLVIILEIMVSIVGNSWKKILWYSGKIAFIFSISIEMLQLLLRLGTFQLSDIFYNTVGGVLGGLMYCAVMKARKRL